jgi:hypothetical protein
MKAKHIIAILVLNLQITVICFAIIAVICFALITCNKKTEIIQLENLTMTYSTYALARMAEYGEYGEHCKYFVVANPPRNNERLLRLLSNHFDSFVSDDTIMQYSRYIHHYYKETRSISRNFKEKENYYSITDRVDYLIMRIIIEPKHNKKEIDIYSKKDRSTDTTIYLQWKGNGGNPQ